MGDRAQNHSQNSAEKTVENDASKQQAQALELRP